MAPSPVHSDILVKWGVPMRPSSVPHTQSDELQGDQQPSSPITSEEADTSFGSGDSNDTSLNTADSSEPDPIDREAVTATILEVLTSHPQISIEVIDWARIFIEEQPQMLGRSSTIVEAHPDAESIRVEFEKGVRAICRVCSNHRLKFLRNSALELQDEWTNAVAKYGQEPQYADYIDLIYTEATAIVERYEGAFRDPEDVDLVGGIFGFAEGGHDAGDKIGPGVADGDVREATEQSLDEGHVTDRAMKVADADAMDTAD